MNHSTGRVAFAALFAGIVVLFAGCMDASLSQSGDAPAGISIRGAPSAISEADISISGGGANISGTIGTGTAELVFELPVGEEHEIKVDTSNFIGRRSFRLPAGGLQVNVRMQEKLFVPDFENQRLVQIDDMTGANWVGTDDTELGGFALPDVTIGPDGRVYAVGLWDGSSDLWVFDSIEDTTPTGFFNGDVTIPVNAVAIDHEEGIVYIGSGQSGDVGLKGIELNGTGDTDYNTVEIIENFNTLWGVSVDSDGFVYLSGTEGFEPPYPVVRKVDPDTETVVWSESYGNELPDESFSDPHVDVLYNSGSLFVTNPSGKDGSKILRLDPQNGEVIDSFGSFPADPANPGQGELYGPRRFVATGNSMITVIDEFADSENVLNYDRLVQFAPDGSDWETFGATGPGEGEFQFFLSATEPIIN